MTMYDKPLRYVVKLQQRIYYTILILMMMMDNVHCEKKKTMEKQTFGSDLFSPLVANDVYHMNIGTLERGWFGIVILFNHH